MTFTHRTANSYCARPPAPPTYFFLIDVGRESFETGMLSLIVNTIKEVISNELL
jgi:hypothetical protein